MFGHCCRWHLDEPTAGMESSPVIGEGIIPNGSFLEMRLRAHNFVLQIRRHDFKLRRLSTPATQFPVGFFARTIPA
jgi:hypothetical protein